MNQLVEVKDGWVFCDSKMVAEKFDVHHPNVTRTCERILEKINSSEQFNLNSWPRIEKRDFEYKGRPFKFYVMNKAAFMMVAMRFTTDKAFEWQLKIVQAFELMENRLAIEESNKKTPHG